MLDFEQIQKVCQLFQQMWYKSNYPSVENNPGSILSTRNFTVTDTNKNKRIDGNDIIEVFIKVDNEIESAFKGPVSVFIAQYGS